MGIFTKGQLLLKTMELTATTVTLGKNTGKDVPGKIKHNDVLVQVILQYKKLNVSLNPSDSHGRAHSLHYPLTVFAGHSIYPCPNRDLSSFLRTVVSLRIVGALLLPNTHGWCQSLALHFGVTMILGECNDLLEYLLDWWYIDRLCRVVGWPSCPVVLD